MRTTELRNPTTSVATRAGRLPTGGRARFARGAACRGMTVVELLTATLLATMLMTAVLGVLRNLALQQKVLFERQPVRTWRLPLIRQIRWDMINARQVVYQPGMLTLNGFAGRSFDNGRATGRPTRVIYYIAQNGSLGFLVRQEIHVDSLNEDNSRLELMLGNVHSMEMNRIDPGGRRQPLSNRPAPAPARLQIRLSGPDGRTSILNEIVSGRWEPK